MSEVWVCEPGIPELVNVVWMVIVLVSAHQSRENRVDEAVHGITNSVRVWAVIQCLPVAGATVVVTIDVGNIPEHAGNSTLIEFTHGVD